MTPEVNKRPKLVVGITVDQMRYDYLYRYWDKYSDGGFKRLINDGFSYENGNYNYTPTYTGPGHTSIYTGTTPSVHGVIGNNWWDKYAKESVYCAGDDSYQTVGSDSDAGQMSPHRMLTTSISDEIRLGTHMKGKSIGVSIKDRGAILPAGHTANGAYWYDKSNGKWITSTYYRDALPDWVANWNASGKVDELLAETWEPLLPIEQYEESLKDNTPFERPFRGQDTPTFPYDLGKLKAKNGYGLISTTPQGNTMTTLFAKAAIEGENLGADQYTDILALSYSSTDYVGHSYGTRAIETEDTYLRLDRDIAGLLAYLDEHVGKGEYTVFLTADHGAALVPLYMQNLNVPAGYFEAGKFKDGLYESLMAEYGEHKWVEKITNDQVFLNHAVLHEQGADKDAIIASIIDFALHFDGISNAVDTRKLFGGYFTDHLLSRLQRGYNQKRSGDVSLILEPGWITYSRQGTTHGSSYTYDTHVPVLLYGHGINQGKSYEMVSITDIAPTIAALLRISKPNGATGTVLAEAIK